jgi:hypothetical protein
VSLGGEVLFTLMFKRYAQGHTVAVEFHPISGFVDQPLWADLWKGITKQLAEVLSTDSLTKSRRACRAPSSALDAVPRSLPLVTLNALPSQVGLAIDVFV